MSISFSGLTSGLDTSSWIESLVSLKRAKVTTLQTQREEIVASKDTLNSIKSFFTAFRSTLQKITAGKFGNTANAMDIFSRNIAKSSHPNILAAIVNETAQEGSYQIKVDQLATKTIATSGYKTVMSESEVNEANLSTKLSQLGITSGNIAITATDIYINKDWTIGELQTEINQKGIYANFNPNSGIFTIGANEGNIDDIDNTGILDALNLKIVTSGVSSKPLTYSTNSSGYADDSTLLNDIDGININTPATVTIKDKDDNLYYVEVTNTTKLGDFLQSIEDETSTKVIAYINPNTGEVTLINGEISSDENIGLMSALNLTYTETTHTGTSSTSLYFKKTVDENTKLGELLDNFDFTDSTSCLFTIADDSDNGNRIPLFSVNENMQLGDFIEQLEEEEYTDYIVSASLENGQISITLKDGYSIYTSPLSDGLGIDAIDPSIEENTFSLTQTSSGPILLDGNPITGSTTLEDLGYDYEEVALQLNTKRLYFNKDSSIDDIISALAEEGVSANLSEDGYFTITGGDTVYVELMDEFFAELLNMPNGSNGEYYTTISTKTYTSSQHIVLTQLTNDNKGSVKLSDLCDSNGNNLGIIGASVNLINDLTGEEIPDTIFNADFTIDEINSNMQDMGYDIVLSVLSGGAISINSTNYKIEELGTAGTSNFLSKIGINSWNEKTFYTSDPLTTSSGGTANANLNTLLNSFNNGSQVAAGNFTINIDGVNKTVNIDSNDTIGDLIKKIQETGLEATFSSNRIHIFSGEGKTFSINDGTSSISTLLDLNTSTIEGYWASNEPIKYETTTSVITNFSAANYADMNTTMEVIGITEGTLQFKKGGTTINLNIEKTDTFNDLNDKLGNDVTLSINDGKIEISSNDDPIYYISTLSSSNFESIVGLSNSENGKVIGTSKLYCVNKNTALTTAGIFRNGDINAGTFKVGDQEITIDNETTISDVIDQINGSETSNATARWDDHNAKLIIESRITGETAIYIQNGTSNFAEVFGFVDENNTLLIDSQELGQKALFSIDGVDGESFFNVLDSSITGITGVTINLKGVSSNGEYTTLIIEKDKETLANAVSNLVDSYNTLIENIDKELARDNSLVSQSGLKSLRNRIRSLMTSSFTNDGNYERLSTIGISTKAASPGDISTAGINKLSFDKNKFIEAFSADPDSVRKLMLGTDANKGIIWQIEDIVDTAVSSVSGYFSTTNNTYNKQISRIDNRIKKASSGVDIYRERLERKFSAMELLITKMQDQYSSFLNAGFMM